MSSIEIAVRKVKDLSESQARDLLDWLAARPERSRVRRRLPQGVRHKRKTCPSMRKLRTWYDSIRGTKDWDPPRMPPEVVHRGSL